MDAHSGSVKRTSYLFILVFLITAAGIIAAGFLSYGHFTRHHRSQEERALQGIASLKVSELVEWRSNCLRSAWIFSQNPSFSSLVWEYLQDPESPGKAGRILAWLQRVCEGSSFDRISLLDRYGTARLAVPDFTASTSALVEAKAREVLKTGKVSFVDFYRNEYDGRIYLNVLVPVHDVRPGGNPIGVVSLRIDPGRYLYPYISRWPVPSHTAETLILRREGGYAVFLNELRFRKHTALKLRIPLADESRPAVRAVKGQRGIVEGIDYQGRPVLADVQPVPGSPWFLVARVGLDEVNAPMKERLRLIALFVASLLAAAGAGLGYAWRHQLVLFYRERLQKELALRDAEARFRVIYQQSPLAIEIYDDAGILREANPACLELFGMYGEEEIKGFSLFEDPNITDEQKDMLRQGMEVRYEAPFDFEKVREMNLYRTAKQGIIWIDVLVTPLRETTGRPGYLVQVQDITERRSAEEALREQFSFLQQLLDAISLPISFKDVQGRYMGCNKAWESDLGMKREDILGKTVFDIAPPELVDRNVRADEALFATGGTLAYEAVVRYADGSDHDVIFSKSTFSGAGGRTAGIVGCYLDITEKKRFEEALKESEEKYRLITETIMDVILTTDSGGVYTYISPSHRRALGRGEEVIGRSVFEHVHPDDADQAAEAFMEALTQRKIGRAEYRYLHPERGYIWLESQGITAEIGGKVTGVIASRDITDRKQAEDALIESEMRVRKKLDAILEPEGDIATLELADILDKEAIQSLMDDFHRITGMGIAIGDLKGNVLVATGWQDVCTKFHRVHPETLANCRESDLSLSAGTDPGAFRLYKCKNNMWDVATPLIIGGAHLGNLFHGQFFFEGEAPDVEVFKAQALRYGFDEGEYLSALDRVPRFSRETIDAVMTFYAKFSSMISRLSYGNIKLARALKERDILLGSLKESEEKYRLVADFTYDWEYWLGPDRKYIYVSPSCERITGYTPAEIARSLDFMLELVHPDDLDLLEKHIREGDTGECGARSLEYRIVRKDGGVRWISHVCTPVYAGDGTYMGSRGSNRDVTRRREMEQALLLERDNLRGIMDAFNDGIYIVNKDCGIEYVNPVIERLFGPVEGRKCHQYLHGRKEPCPWCKNTEVMAGRSVTWEWESPQNGRVYELFDAPFRNPDGSVFKVEFFHDITNRKRSEQELREKNTELERFTYMISHDLKSPLVTVKTFLGYLVQDLEKSDSERVESDMHYMRTAADKMSQLLDELLEMSRIGRLTNPPVGVTFRELAEEALSMVAGRISQRGVRVSLHDGDVVLFGDRARLGEIWQNLVENAVKFMGDQESPAIELGIDLDGPDPVFFVSDNGMGIELKFQDKIFGLFEKLDASKEGTGLGLALVKRIVELYRGGITVLSEGPGRGSRFQFTLPEAVRKKAGTA